MIRTAALVLIAAPAACTAQSLFLQPFPAAPSASEVPYLRGISMLAIEPPQPRTYAIHDLVTILIDENSRASSSQTLDTKKDSEINAKLNKLLDLEELLETRLVQGNLTGVDLIDASGASKFKGDGDYERSDRFTARITAEIIDVKPNGTLVVEARKAIVRDREESVIVLTGICRQEDVTSQNTVLSSQLADLVVEQHNTGDLKDAASKGFLTRIAEAIFNF
ncbi:MAG: flagellar basal body L-ring protein FlgH [Phycisphaeraceae bacterium]|nr:flagellar basal body L-ring protein FlgH [Phycisphaeraceae bacterium]